MATADYDFSLSRNQIIERAFELIGVRTRGQPLSGDALQEGKLALDMMVKSWQGKNVFLWTVKTIPQSLTAGNASYSLALDPPILSLDAAYLLNGANDHNELDVLSWRDYQSIPDKSSSGNPVAVALDGQANPTLYVYPVPTASGTISLNAICKLKDWDSPTNGADFPVRWERAIVYGLAADLADGYGLPLGERDRLAVKADRLFIEARQGDKENVTDSFVRGSYPVRRR